MTVIKDGTGTGVLTKVDEENNFHTISVSVPEAAHVSIRDKKTFSILGRTTIAAGIEKTVLVIINNSTNLLGIDNILVSLQGESGKITIFRTYVGTRTYTTGGSSKTPVNLNVTSTGSIDVTAVENNPTLGGSDSEAFSAFFESTGSFATAFDGRIVLGISGSIRVTVEGDALAAGTKIGLTRVILYQMNEDIHI